MDMESLPTGMLMPSAGHSSMPTALTVSYSAASSPGSPQAAIHTGYDRAWATILDSNVTTMIAGMALFMFGTGPVKGFAVTLCLGILSTLFSAIFVSRLIFDYFLEGRSVSRLSV